MIDQVRHQTIHPVGNSVKVKKILIISSDFDVVQCMLHNCCRCLTPYLCEQIKIQWTACHFQLYLLTLWFLSCQGPCFHPAPHSFRCYQHLGLTVLDLGIVCSTILSSKVARKWEFVLSGAVVHWVLAVFDGASSSSKSIAATTSSEAGCVVAPSEEEFRLGERFKIASCWIWVFLLSITSFDSHSYFSQG